MREVDRKIEDRKRKKGLNKNCILREKHNNKKRLYYETEIR